MIENYTLYYSYKNIGDVLIVYLDDILPMTSYKRSGDVVTIYSDDRLIGYNIFNISKIIKIKYSGALYLPNKMLIDVINSVLKNSKNDTLSYHEYSGYVSGCVIDGNEVEGGYLFKVNIGEDILSCFSKELLNIGDKVIVALSGTRLSNGKMVRESNINGVFTNAHICTFKDLDISEDNASFINEEDLDLGNDFFVFEG